MKQEQTLQILAERMDKIEKTLEHMHYDIEELVYPPEDKIKKSYIEKVEQESKEGKYRLYKTIGELRQEIENE